MELDFKECKTPEDVKKFFQENKQEIERLKGNMRIMQGHIDRLNEEKVKLHNAIH